MVALPDWLQVRGEDGNTRVSERSLADACRPRPETQQQPPVRARGTRMTMPTSLRPNVRRGVSAIALGLAMTAILPGAAMAQDADPAGADAAAVDGAIVVTGIRGPPHNSVQAKKANTSTVQLVSAADLGKLPYP